MEDRNEKLYLDLLNKIVTQVDETQECIAKLDKKLDLNIQEVKHEITLINLLDERQNQMLEEHIKRTEISEKRLDLLEEEHRFKTKVKNYVLGLGALAGAVYAIITLINLLRP